MNLSWLSIDMVVLTRSLASCFRVREGVLVRVGGFYGICSG